MGPYQAALALGEATAAATGVLLALPGGALRGAAGVWAGGRAGNSVEFQEYRDYQPGDDLRHIDWGVYARTDRLTIKRFREEVTPHLDLVIDGSRSMALEGTAKGEATAALAALLARAATNTGLRPRPWLTGEGCQLLPGDHPGAWPLAFEGATDVAAAVRQRPPAWRAGGVRLLVSDLLWPGAPTALLAPMGRGAAAVVVVQVLARRDLDPAVCGPVRLEDAEQGTRQDTHLPAAHEAYRRALALHGEAWRRAVRGSGARLVTLVAEDFLENLTGPDLKGPDLKGAGQAARGQRTTALGPLLAAAVLRAAG